MGCITTLLAAALTAVVVWLTAFQFVPPGVVKQLSAFSGLWVLWGVTVYRALEKPMRREEVNWSTAPIYHVEMHAKVNARQLKRDTINLTLAEWRELWKIARDMDAGESFTFRSVPNYNFWRKRFFRWGWAAWVNPGNKRDGVVMTERGEDWLSHFANSPSPGVQMYRNAMEIPLHTQDCKAGE